LTTQTHLQASTAVPEISREREEEPEVSADTEQLPSPKREKMAELQSSLNQLGNFTKNLKATRERGN
jgi:hypothetical protein